jgi:trimeric autotransporter adhesin
VQHSNQGGSRLVKISCLVVAALGIAGCGGGSGSAPPAPVSTTTAVPISVIDGPIKGATVCLDKNGNGVCDAGEPSGTTDVSGNVTLTVNNADIGMFPVVVMVGTDAVDADTGPVPVAYVMQAPADQVSVVSPLTTIVQAQIASSGGTSAQAASIVQSQTGLTVSLFSNYTLTASASSDSQAAANLARLLVVTSQQQATALASVVGQTDLSGGTVSRADLQASIVEALTNSLPALAAAASDPTVAAASTPAARDAALSALASTLIANGQAGLTATTALAAVGIAKLPPDEAAIAPQAGATLRAFTFTDSSNWFFRAMEATLADNTPDANGLVHYYDNRTQDVGGTTTTWGLNNTVARQGDLHWDGTEWVGCAFGFRSSQAPRDANGITHYNYCDSRHHYPPDGASSRYKPPLSNSLTGFSPGTADRIAASVSMSWGQPAKGTFQLPPFLPTFWSDRSIRLETIVDNKSACNPHGC